MKEIAHEYGGIFIVMILFAVIVYVLLDVLDSIWDEEWFGAFEVKYQLENDKDYFNSTGHDLTAPDTWVGD